MVKPQKTVWITRTKCGAERTALRVTQRGHVAMVAPVLQVQELWPLIAFWHYGAIIVTSENALHVLKDKAVDRTLPVMCVGQQTQRAVLDLGFTSVTNGGGSVRSLFERVCEMRAPHDRLLYLRGDIVSAPLKDWLEAAAFRVTEAITYATETTVPDVTVEQWRQIDTILLHSARAAQAVAPFVGLHQRPEGTGSIRVIAISKTVADSFAQALSDLGISEATKAISIAIAPEPDDSHMINLIA